MSIPKSIKCILLFLLVYVALLGNANGQENDRWHLSVNKNRKPLDVLMEFGDSEMGITYLFDISSDTLNMAFVAEEALVWKNHSVSVFTMPKGKELLKIKLDDVDMENVQVVFSRVWNAMPKKYKNVITLFELHEYGTTARGDKIKSFIIRFKMKRPRRRNSIEL